MEPLLQALLAAGRKVTPSDHVPYAFEKRIMSAIAGRPAPDRMSVWTLGLWRAALSSLAVAALLVTANALAPDHALESSTDSLEAVLVASVDLVP